MHRISLTGRSRVPRHEWTEEGPLSGSELRTAVARRAHRGDRVTIETTAPGHHRSVRFRWPMSEDNAAEAVDVVSAEPLLAGNDELVLRFRSGWWGRIGIEKMTGPPQWRLPKMRGWLGLTKSGRPTVAVLVGWRFTAFRVTYIANPGSQAEDSAPEPAVEQHTL